MNQSDKGYCAFIEKDWTVASIEFTKKVKKPRKKGNNIEQHSCESLEYAAISIIHLNSDKADEVYKYLDKSFRTDGLITKQILHHIVSDDFPNMIIISSIFIPVLKLPKIGLPCIL